MPQIDKVNTTQNEIDLLWEKSDLQMFEKMFPEEYRSLEALDFFIRALEVGRATTEKELFNLYEENLHRQKMEKLQLQQVQYARKALSTQQEQLKVSQEQSVLAKKQIENMKQIEKGQKKISKQTRYGNVVNTINLLKK